MDYLIVGAGFAGCTAAEILASQYDRKVLVVEQREHIGGNAYDCHDVFGVLIQRYGPHIFHTSSEKVWNYLTQFTEWNNYVHRVIAKVNGKEVYLPLNLETMEKLCERTFTAGELQVYFEKKRLKLSDIKNAKDVVVSQVGEELYDLFFKNYTKKQWGVYPEELDAQVTKRLPVRFNRDTRYFSDRFQGLPRDGFAKMFEKMLTHKNIEVVLGTDYKTLVDKVPYKKIICTAPIDHFFDYAYGKLPYRGLKFKFETRDIENFQNAGVVNYPNEHEYTRITEFKKLYLQKLDKTTICFEFPHPDGIPCYPIPKKDCRELYLKYKRLVDEMQNTFFVGRLAEYAYLNMDQVVERAMDLVDGIMGAKNNERGFHAT